MELFDYVKLDPDTPDLERAVGDAGIDLSISPKFNDFEHYEIVLDAQNVGPRFIMYPNKIFKIHTGVSVEIPFGHMGIIKERSGLGSQGFTVHGGVVDAMYRGPIYVAAEVTHFITFDEYDRIAQMIVIPYPELNILRVEKLTETKRGEDGFGSTGK